MLSKRWRTRSSNNVYFVLFDVPLLQVNMSVDIATIVADCVDKARMLPQFVLAFCFAFIYAK